MNFKSIMEYCNLITSTLGEEVLIDYSIASKPYIEEQKLTTMDSLIMEKEVLGLNISPLPLAKLRDRLKNANYKSLIECFDLKDRFNLKVLGYLENIYSFKTKKGDDMATLTFIDETSSIEVTLFSENYKKFKLDLKVGQYYTINGYVQHQPKFGIVAQNLIIEKNMEALING